MAAAAETGKILRTAREAAGKTVAEMASATRINARFLGEIEDGTSFSLPAIYRRTFVRTYARALGVDPDGLPQDAPPAAETPAPGPPAREERGAIAAGPPVEEGAAGRIGSNPFAERSQLRTMVIVVALLVTAFIFSIKWFASSPDGPPSDPAPAALAETTAAPRRDPLPAFSAGGGAPGAADSLVLHASTTESVWVHIVIDNDSTVEFTLPPRYSITLRAKDNFVLSAGNPAGLSLSLNGRKIGLPGTGDNRPVKNVFLSKRSPAE